MSCFFDNLLPIMFVWKYILYVAEEVCIHRRKINKILKFKQKKFTLHVDYSENL